jgi:hypothetical protein
MIRRGIPVVSVTRSWPIICAVADNESLMYVFWSRRPDSVAKSPISVMRAVSVWILFIFIFSKTPMVIYYIFR